MTLCTCSLLFTFNPNFCIAFSTFAISSAESSACEAAQRNAPASPSSIGLSLGPKTSNKPIQIEFTDAFQNPDFMHVPFNEFNVLSSDGEALNPQEVPDTA